jgi:hypothetical protein
VGHLYTPFLTISPRWQRYAELLPGGGFVRQQSRIGLVELPTQFEVGQP